jgi:hypothetical protein
MRVRYIRYRGVKFFKIVIAKVCIRSCQRRSNTCYNQFIDEVEEVRRAAWTLHYHGRFTERIILSTKEQIMALKLAKQYTVVSISLQELHLRLDI